MKTVTAVLIFFVFVFAAAHSSAQCSFGELAQKAVAADQDLTGKTSHFGERFSIRVVLPAELEQTPEILRSKGRYTAMVEFCHDAETVRLWIEPASGSYEVPEAYIKVFRGWLSNLEPTSSPTWADFKKSGDWFGMSAMEYIQTCICGHGG